MKHEKVIKREDGSRLRIFVNFWSDYRDGANYSICVERCEPGKRTFFNVHNMDDYAWRRMNTQERAAFIKNTQLEHVTEQEILQAKLELWEKLKPV